MKDDAKEIYYIQAYKLLLGQTLFWGRTRAFFFGYNSKGLENYIEQQQDKIFSLENKAYDKGFKIHNRENLNLGARLLGLKSDIMMSYFR